MSGNVDEAGFLFSGQAGLQVFLLLISFAAVPCMLLPKPLILKKRHEASQNVSSPWLKPSVGHALGFRGSNMGQQWIVAFTCARLLPGAG